MVTLASQISIQLSSVFRRCVLSMPNLNITQYAEGELKNKKTAADMNKDGKLDYAEFVKWLYGSPQDSRQIMG